jgi:hypothetical protein
LVLLSLWQIINSLPGSRVFFLHSSIAINGHFHEFLLLLQFAISAIYVKIVSSLHLSIF